MDDEARRTLRDLQKLIEQSRPLWETARLNFAQVRPTLEELAESIRSVRDLSHSVAQVSDIVASLPTARLVLADSILRDFEAHSVAINADLLKKLTTPSSSTIQAALAITIPVTPEIRADLNEALKSFAIAANRLLKPSLAALLDARFTEAQRRRVIKAFEYATLWLAPSMPDDLVDQVVQMHQQGTKPGPIASVVSRRYAKQDWGLLRTTVNSFVDRSLFIDSKQTILDALEAHCSEKFTLTVPALLLLVEGLCADYVKRKNLLPSIGQQTTRIIVAALESVPCDPSDILEYAAVSGVVEYVQNHLYAYVDFDASYESLRKESRLRAHASRHGRQREAATRMNSLRLFLLLDVMSLFDD